MSKSAAKKTWTVQPRGALRGTVRVPGDKSVSHRALLLNALAPGTARVRNLLGSEDIEASANAARAFGAKVQQSRKETIVAASTGLVEPQDVVDCGNSGTSIRLVAGIAASQPFLTVLTGDASLRRRPMDRVLGPLQKMGAIVDGRAGGRLAPVAIRGGNLQMVHHELPIASAQIKSALILAGLGVGVAVREPRQSRDHTERMLLRMGASIRHTPEGWLVVLPTDRLEPVDVDVPGDLSAAAFFLVAGAIVPGSEIVLPAVGVNETRSGILDVLTAMGANLEITPVEAAGAEPQADLVIRSSALRGTVIEGELSLRALDELPVIAVAAAFAEGETIIADAEELRVKESDRIARVVAGLRALGVEVEERPDGMIIAGGRPRGPGQVDATGDHRIAMAFAVAGAAAPGGVMVTGAESVASSFPEFPRHLEGLLG